LHASKIKEKFLFLGLIQLINARKKEVIKSFWQKIFIKMLFQKKVNFFPSALSNHLGFNLFKMNNPLWGGLLSTPWR